MNLKEVIAAGSTHLPVIFLEGRSKSRRISVVIDGDKIQIRNCHIPNKSAELFRYINYILILR